MIRSATDERPRLCPDCARPLGRTALTARPRRWARCPTPARPDAGHAPHPCMSPTLGTPPHPPPHPRPPPHVPYGHARPDAAKAHPLPLPGGVSHARLLWALFPEPRGPRCVSPRNARGRQRALTVEGGLVPGRKVGFSTPARPLPRPRLGAQVTVRMCGSLARITVSNRFQEVSDASTTNRTSQLSISRIPVHPPRSKWCLGRDGGHTALGPGTSWADAVATLHLLNGSVLLNFKQQPTQLRDLPGCRGWGHIGRSHPEAQTVCTGSCVTSRASWTCFSAHGDDSQRAP